jgi:hypothetical protein
MLVAMKPPTALRATSLTRYVPTQKSPHARGQKRTAPTHHLLRSPILFIYMNGVSFVHLSEIIAVASRA